MAASFAQWVIDLFGDRVSAEVLVFLISMLPILELRGGMIAAKLLGLPFLRAFVLCYLGNLLPIPLILLFIRKIFSWLKHFRAVERTIDKLEARSLRKAAVVQKYRLLGLLVIVAIPIPGTGAWTGALIADLLDIRIRRSMPVIALGVLIAGLLMSAFTYGLFGLID